MTSSGWKQGVRRRLAGSPKLEWVYRQRGLFPLVTDIGVWAFALWVGAGLKLATSIGVAVVPIFVIAGLAVAVQVLMGFGSGLYRSRWRVASFREVWSLGTVWAVAALVATGVNHLWRRGYSGVLPTAAVIMGCLAALVGMAASRVVWRAMWELSMRPEPTVAKPTIVIGAGNAGTKIVRAMLLDRRSAYMPVAVLDDDRSKQQREIDGIHVVGATADLETIAAKYEAEVVLVAITEAPSSFVYEINERAIELGLEVLVLPPQSELMGQLTVADVRPPTVDELLGRPMVEIDLESVSGYVRGKRVLITGAGGSIGSELSKQIHEFSPSELYLLDRDENALHGVQLELEGRALLNSDLLVVADIRDRPRMMELFAEYRPQVVFHAAALKHLTLLERHPGEGVKTNLRGTQNLLAAAVSVGVERFVNVSTDKAADPTSILGATKLGAERATAHTAEVTGLPYVSVRFGNVLGSRGSVLPTFLSQLEKGLPLTVTHPDVTRYFMTIPEAVRLVIQAGAIGDPGEVMVLDMGEPVKIVDLAKQLISVVRPGTPIEFTGLRPGEKLHEVLFGGDEIGVSRHHPRIRHTAVECYKCPPLLIERELVTFPDGTPNPLVSETIV